MAFWRPWNMDSRNPFKRAFWRWGNLFGKSNKEKSFYLKKEKCLTDIKDAVQKAHPEDGYPDILFCPLSRNLIIDPVITIYGYIYNKLDLEKHLRRHHTDPTARQPLVIKQVIPFTELSHQFVLYGQKKRQYFRLKAKALKEAKEDAISFSPGEDPPSLTCQISLDIINSPVITPYGHVYDKINLIRWLTNRKIDPNTGLPLTISQLRPFPEFKIPLNIFNKRRELHYDKNKKLKPAKREKIQILHKNENSLQTFFTSCNYYCRNFFYRLSRKKQVAHGEFSSIEQMPQINISFMS